MEISNFKEKNIIKQIGKGVESTVYLYNDNGLVVVLKKFNDNPIISSDNDNKELKVIILKNEELLQKDVHILNRVYSYGKFIGYTSIYEPYESIDVLRKKKDKLYALKLLQERYEELNKRGIFIGDFNATNFSLKENILRLYDIDNFRIDNLDFNVTNPVMNRYISKCKNIDKIDYYCFNFFALSYLTGYLPDVVLNNAAIKSFPKEYRTKEILNFIKYLRSFNDESVIEKDENGKQKTILSLIK